MAGGQSQRTFSGSFSKQSAPLPFSAGARIKQVERRIPNLVFETDIGNREIGFSIVVEIAGCHALHKLMTARKLERQRRGGTVRAPQRHQIPAVHHTRTGGDIEMAIAVEIAQGDRVAVDAFTECPLALAPALRALVEEDHHSVALSEGTRAARAEPFRYCNQVEQAIAVPVHRADSA